MVHNGTIFDYWQLDKYFKIQDGDTDSERILMYLVDRENEKTRELGREPDENERFLLLDEIVSDMAKGNKLNLPVCIMSMVLIRKFLFHLQSRI